MKKIKTFDTFFWWSLVAFIAVVALICFFPAWFTSNFSKYNFTTTGQIGDTIGGIMGPFIAIAAAGLTFLAFWVQYKANEQQKADIKDLKLREEKEKLETKFFEMIKLHRENVGELSFTYTKKKLAKFSDIKDVVKEHTANSRKVFKIIFSDFKCLIEELNHFFKQVKEEDVYEEAYLNKLKNNKTIKSRSIDLVIYAKVDILYCILYFGLSSDDQDTIKNFFKDRYKEDFFLPILLLASIKPKEESEYWDGWSKLNKIEIKTRIEIVKEIKNKKSGISDHNSIISRGIKRNLTFREFAWPEKYDKFYGGHQFRLGHYFRHLYQSVTFINSSKLFDYNQKYSNVKLLRGQLSTFEQSIIFLNSLSVLGRIWELEDRDHPEMAIEMNDQLITKYNFITNILSDKIVDTVLVSNFYPDVDYEATLNTNIKEIREALKTLHYQNQFKNTQNED